MSLRDELKPSIIQLSIINFVVKVIIVCVMNIRCIHVYPADKPVIQ